MMVLKDFFKLAALKVCVMHRKKDGFGMNELLGIVATLVVAAFVIIPGLRTFAGTVMSKLTEWWNTIQGNIFQ